MADDEEKKPLNFHQMDLDDRILKVNIYCNITSTLATFKHKTNLFKIQFLVNF